MVSFKRSHRVMGIDCSTNSIAYAIMQDEKLIAYDELPLKGTTVYARALDARNQIEKNKEQLQVDIVFIEKTIAVKSVRTAISMAYVAGNVITALMEINKNLKVMEPEPLVWQSYIGNPLLKKAERDLIRVNNPGKSKSWYTNAGRLLRKQRTKDWVLNKFGVTVDSDNQSDSIAICWWGAQNA